MTAIDVDVPDRPLLEWFVQWCVRLTNPLAFLGVLGMLVVSGLTMYDVLARWAFSSGIPALNEITGLTFSVAVAACIPAGLAQGVNLKVDLFEKALRGRWKEWLTFLGDLLLLVTVLGITWSLLKYAAGLAAQNRSSVILAWPMAPFSYTAACLFAMGGVVQCLIALNSFWRAIKVAQTEKTALWLKVFTIIVAAAVAYIAYEGLHDPKSFSRWVIGNPGLAITIACLVSWALLLILVPVAAAMGIIGFVGVATFIGLTPTASVLSTEISGFLTNNNVAVLPLFLMMGSFATVAGIADDAYALAHSVLSRFSGGLAMATIAGCAGFGAVTGSSVATAATIGRVALPQMISRGYSPALSTGSIAAGGTLGNLVPPGSGPLVLFALLTEASIGQLFIASVIPAVLVIIAYLAAIWIFVRFHPDSAPSVTKAPPGEFGQALRRCGPLFVLFFGTLGGMYTGVITATEAAAVGAFGAFLIAILRGKLQAGKFWAVMAEVTQVTAMIYMLIFGALVFAYFCELTGIAAKAAAFIGTLNWSPLALITVILITFVGLGTFMDSYAVMIITIPIITPLVLAAGYDIVWWGVINLFVIEIGAISPPFGLNMFVLKTIGDVSLKSIFYGSTWFCIAAIITLAILVLFPALSLWLPSTM